MSDNKTQFQAVITVVKGTIREKDYNVTKDEFLEMFEDLWQHFNSTPTYEVRLSWDEAYRRACVVWADDISG